MISTSGPASVIAVAPGALAAVDRLDAVLSRDAPDPEDRCRVAAWPAEQARQHLGARCLLRDLLTRAGLPATSRVATAPRGQPYLPDLSTVGISLSHCGTTVAAAVGLGQEIGIDVHTPAPVGPEMIRRCCTVEVRAPLAELPPAERAREFAWIWTVQEACVKAAGTGLAGAPWRIPVALGQTTGGWNGYSWTALRDRFDIPVSVAVRATMERNGHGLR